MKCLLERNWTRTIAEGEKADAAMAKARDDAYYNYNDDEDDDDNDDDEAVNAEMDRVTTNALDDIDTDEYDGNNIMSSSTSSSLRMHGNSRNTSRNTSSSSSRGKGRGRGRGDRALPLLDTETIKVDPLGIHVPKLAQGMARPVYAAQDGHNGDVDDGDGDGDDAVNGDMMDGSNSNSNTSSSSSSSSSSFSSTKGLYTDLDGTCASARGVGLGSYPSDGGTLTVPRLPRATAALCSFLLNTAGVPCEWIEEVRAVHAVSQGNPNAAMVHYLGAGMLSDALCLFARVVGPQWIAADRQDLARAVLLTHFADTQVIDVNEYADVRDICAVMLRFFDHRDGLRSLILEAAEVADRDDLAIAIGEHAKSLSLLHEDMVQLSTPSLFPSTSLLQRVALSTLIASVAETVKETAILLQEWGHSLPFLASDTAANIVAPIPGHAHLDGLIQAVNM